MSTQYEVEHGIAPAAQPARPTRRVDMSSFLNFLSQITPSSPSSPPTTTTSTTTSATHSSPRVFSDPTPADINALYGLVRDQLAVLASTAPTDENRTLLETLARDVAHSIDSPPAHLARGGLPGVSAQFVDALDRVPKKRLRAGDACPICAEDFLADPYPLVVELPCHHTHRFDLECIQPWLRSQGTCPLCKKDFTPQPPKEVVRGAGEGEDEDEDDEHGMYA
jgi:hypothetical protein